MVRNNNLKKTRKKKNGCGKEKNTKPIQMADTNSRNRIFHSAFVQPLRNSYVCLLNHVYFTTNAYIAELEEHGLSLYKGWRELDASRVFSRNINIRNTEEAV